MLIFDSRFESGNLRKASKVNNVEYNLWLENDLNTKGHTQWYYFKVVYRQDKPAKIQFNILNLGKPYSLYKLGMKPVVFSRRKFEDSGYSQADIKKGWHRACDEIKYYQNDIPRYTCPQNKFDGQGDNDKVLFNHNGYGEGIDTFSTLSFMYKFEYTEDEVWFAHAVPYTYTDLMNELAVLRRAEDMKLPQDR